MSSTCIAASLPSPAKPSSCNKEEFSFPSPRGQTPAPQLRAARRVPGPCGRVISQLSVVFSSVSGEHAERTSRRRRTSVCLCVLSMPLAPPQKAAQDYHLRAHIPNNPLRDTRNSQNPTRNIFRSARFAAFTMFKGRSASNYYFNDFYLFILYVLSLSRADTPTVHPQLHTSTTAHFLRLDTNINEKNPNPTNRAEEPTDFPNNQTKNIANDKYKRLRNGYRAKKTVRSKATERKEKIPNGRNIDREEVVEEKGRMCHRQEKVKDDIGKSFVVKQLRFRWGGTRLSEGVWI